MCTVGKLFIADILSTLFKSVLNMTILEISSREFSPLWCHKVQVSYWPPSHAPTHVFGYCLYYLFFKRKIKDNPHCFIHLFIVIFKSLHQPKERTVQMRRLPVCRQTTLKQAVHKKEIKEGGVWLEAEPIQGRKHLLLHRGCLLLLLLLLLILFSFWAHFNQ